MAPAQGGAAGLLESARALGPTSSSGAETEVGGMQTENMAPSRSAGRACPFYAHPPLIKAEQQHLTLCVWENGDLALHDG